MPHAPVTPATLAVFLVIEGALGTVFRGVPPFANTPIQPEGLLKQDVRAGLGLTDSGITLLYKVDNTEILFDLAGENATVWFSGADWAAAGVLFEQVLIRKFGDAAVAAQVEEPTGGRRLDVRTYHVAPADTPRAAILSMTVGKPDAEGADQMFFIRVFPQERVS
jgi:hypothetical protein